MTVRMASCFVPGCTHRQCSSATMVSPTMCRLLFSISLSSTFCSMPETLFSSGTTANWQLPLVTAPKSSSRLALGCVSTLAYFELAKNCVVAWSAKAPAEP